MTDQQYGNPRAVQQPSVAVQKLGLLLGTPVRWLTRVAPDVVTRGLVHLHRPMLGDVEVAINHDGFKILVNPQDNCGGRLYYWGSYEPDATTWFKSLLVTLRPSLFVDIGANIGHYTFTAARLGVPRIIAVEPSPALASNLERSTKLNGWGRPQIQIVQAAIADSNGTTRFWLNREEHNFGTGSLLRARQTADNRSVVVPCYTGDHLLCDEHPDQVLVKIDVEGAECLALKGMTDCLPRLRPTLMIELHPAQLATFGHSSAEVLRLLRGFGYELARLDRTKEVTIASASSLRATIQWIVARPERGC